MWKQWAQQNGCAIKVADTGCKCSYVHNPLKGFTICLPEVARGTADVLLSLSSLKISHLQFLTEKS